MFKDKKFAIPCIAEWILPWLVLLPGIPAIYFSSTSTGIFMDSGPGPAYDEAKGLFDLYYSLSLDIGSFIAGIELIIFVVGIIWMFKSVFNHTQEPYAITKPLILWMCALCFLFGTLILMFLVHAFTYGMGI